MAGAWAKGVVRSIAGGLAAFASLLAAGCADDPEPAEPNPDFVAMRIELNLGAEGNRGEVYVRLWGAEGDPGCSWLESPVDFEVNGVSGGVQFPGGYSSDDPMTRSCLEATILATGVPLEERVSLRIESPSLSAEAEWRGEHRLWSDSNIADAMATGEPFTLLWIPEEAPLPTLSVIDAAGGGQLEDPVAVLDESGPGQASYLFEGGTPPDGWLLLATSMLVDQVVSPCSLRESCILDSLADFRAP